MKTTNLVLYAVSDGTRRPLLSLTVEGVDRKGVPLADESKDAAVAGARFSHAMSREFARCDSQGLPHSAIKLVSETRESNEAGQQTSATFQEVDFAFSPKGKPVGDIAVLFEGV